MKKLKEFLSSSKTNVVVFVLTTALVLTVSMGAASAAVSIVETYSSRVQMFDIGVTLVENGEDVSWRNYDYISNDGTWDEHTGVLLAHMLQEGEEVTFGKDYTEELTIYNSGTINQFVRVSIYRYWGDAEGNKIQGLDPGLIDLHLVNLGSVWLEDESSRTKERTVLYYNSLLNSGVETPLFADKLTISSEVSDNPDLYDGLTFWIEVEVDAIQEHNVEGGVWGAWGADGTGNNGKLNLN